MVVEEAWRTGGVAGEVASTNQEEAFDSLDGPVIRVGGVDVPTPYGRQLEEAAIPDAARVIAAVEKNFGI